MNASFNHDDFMDKGRIVELYRGELWECQLLETILKDEGVACFLTNTACSCYAPIIVSTSLIKVMVFEADIAKGLEILERFKESRGTT